MWSIGTIAYILLCGSRPFWARSESEYVLQFFLWFVIYLISCLGHPWLANYHDVKIPLDMIIYKLVKAYICSSSLRKAALGWTLLESVAWFAFLQHSSMVPDLHILNLAGCGKNSTEAMKDSRVLDYAHMVMVSEANFLSSLEFKDEINGILYISQMSTLQYRKLDFEEFCAAAISVHQLERMESWEQHTRSTYELFDKDGKKPYYDRGISLGMLFFPSLLWLLTESSHKLAISWHLILATKVSAKSTRNWRANNFQLMMLTILCFILHITSSVYEAAKEKIAPFSSLTDDERYTSCDLEKASQQVAKPLYDAKVQPTTLVPKQVGNMYTTSLYAAFVSYSQQAQLIGSSESSHQRSEQTPLKEKANFCNDLQKLASRVKESEIAERGNGKKSPVVTKI
ncbi:hypothetical protein RHMOL_Rhmol06G0139000 [Rhododendron molle]|uniref:Uncharacterized protein n=1 Tax=Rhododendron molle TaxID=49168 RepID=A0ACC0NCV9_RHOML|nr:hypothetical protein RHMOL_Rhmol06G0139000 [Rhododendron molle]